MFVAARLTARTNTMQQKVSPCRQDPRKRLLLTPNPWTAPGTVPCFLATTRPRLRAHPPPPTSAVSHPPPKRPPAAGAPGTPRRRPQLRSTRLQMAPACKHDSRACTLRALRHSRRACTLRLEIPPPLYSPVVLSPARPPSGTPAPHAAPLRLAHARSSPCWRTALKSPQKAADSPHAPL